MARGPLVFQIWLFFHEQKTIQYILHSYVKRFIDNTTADRYIIELFGIYASSLCKEVWETLLVPEIRFHYISGRYNYEPFFLKLDQLFSTKWFLYNNMYCLRFNTITKVILYIYPVLDNLVLTINDLSINWNIL